MAILSQYLSLLLMKDQMKARAIKNFKNLNLDALFIATNAPGKCILDLHSLYYHYFSDFVELTLSVCFLYVLIIQFQYHWKERV